MFTGIITDIGTIARVEASAGKDMLFEVHAHQDIESIAIGASICHQGACLTVVEKGALEADKCWWTVQVSQESLSKTNLGEWQVGTPVNLERSLKLGDELGGHMVSGHVDGVGEVVSVTSENESWRIKVKAPSDLAKYIAAKGSIALNGISLTVNEVDGDMFGINIIPHTWSHTTIGGIQPGSKVNLEIDPLARYVSRLLSYGS